MTEMEGSNRPLALKSWTAQRNSHIEAVRAAKSALYARENNHTAVTDFIDQALDQRIVSQSGANWDQYTTIERTITPDEIDYVEGMRPPSALVGYLLWHEQLQSIETGRRTHPYTWDTWETVDRPIREDLDTADFLATQKQKSPTLYRFKNLNFTDESGYTVQVDRKRTVRRHFGGRVLSVVRNSVVLHDTDPADRLPKSIKKLISQERRRARSEKYDYDNHSEELHAHLEEHVSKRQDGDKLSWIIPLLTTYYAVKINAVKADVLKQIVDE